MFNKKSFWLKIKNNKIYVLIISVIVVSAIYFGAEKAIDSYIFNKNSDIVGEDSNSESTASNNVNNSSVEEVDTKPKNWFERLFGGEDEEVTDVAEGIEEGEDTVNGQLRDDEIDLVLDEVVDGTETR